MNPRRKEIVTSLLGYRSLGLIVIGLFFFGSYAQAPQRIEDGVFSLTSRLVASYDYSSQVALLAIDKDSIDRLGPWPWPRDRIAGVIDRLRRLEVGTVGLMIPLNVTQTPEKLSELSKSASSSSSKVRSALRRWARSLDTDGTLSRAMEKAGNVIIYTAARESYGGTLNPPWSGPDAPSNGGVSKLRHFFRSILFSPPLSGRFELERPLGRFENAASAVGILNLSEFTDGRTAVNLAIRTKEDFLPTFITLLTARSLGVSMKVIKAVPGQGLRVGGRFIRTAPDFNYYAPPLVPAKAQSGLHMHSLADFLNDPAKHKDLRGATVIIGPTDSGLSAMYGLANRGGLAPAIHAAHALDSLVKDTGFTRPDWFYAGQRGLIIALGLLLFFPAGFHGRRSLYLAGALAIIMLNGGLVALVTRQLWIPVALPSLCTACVLGGLSVRRFFETGAFGFGREVDELRMRYATNLQSQDRLDEAFDEFKRCARGPQMMQKIYQLGLDFERRRKLDSASAVYQFLLGYDARYQDVRVRLERLQKLAGDFPTLSPVGASRDTILIGDTKLEKPMLGHYRLDRQIGQGAMARVYLATDSKLNRSVALKVLSIREDYNGGDIEAIEQRFRREAEAEARMSHPNIVTVYEAGKHGDLVYIAMDYVNGTTLEEFTDPDNLLPVGEVLGIGIQAAKALDYAHGKEIIHRDVKPSNVLYVRDELLVKVSDFGIARISDGDQTRTGTILGTPAYMSPEQAVGGKIDGRSDLFSLGTTLYQLLSGTLPFTGDSVPTIMLQITREKHRSLSRVRPDLSRRLSRTIDTALEKDPDDRFQSGLEMAEALEDCKESQKKTKARSGKSGRRPGRGSRSRSSAA
ncbi:MAG TPA: serine/threonine-protein kinase [Gammaproteobacteria bacterium]|nr:serine/threonine-protein kinase [Gammaproteobacteria bacterium]